LPASISPGFYIHVAMDDETPPSAAAAGTADTAVSSGYAAAGIFQVTPN
jgi:hypothetical protein